MIIGPFRKIGILGIRRPSHRGRPRSVSACMNQCARSVFPAWQNHREAFRLGHHVLLYGRTAVSRQWTSLAGRVLSEATPDGTGPGSAIAHGCTTSTGADQHPVTCARAGTRAQATRHPPDPTARGSYAIGTGTDRAGCTRFARSRNAPGTSLSSWWWSARLTWVWRPSSMVPEMRLPRRGSSP